MGSFGGWKITAAPKSSPERHDRTESLALLTDRFGFSDQSHTNRRFNRAYGGAPGPSAAR